MVSYQKKTWKQELWVVSCRTLSKEISPQELQKTQIEEDAKGLRVENQSLREQLANEQRTLSQSSLVIGKPWETDKMGILSLDLLLNSLFGVELDLS